MKKNFLIFSIISYVISLVTPVFSYIPPDFTRSETFGYQYAGLGWMMIAAPLDFITWLCNLSLIVSWIIYKKDLAKYLAYFTVIPMLFYGLDYVLKPDLYAMTEYRKIPIGYVFWLLSGLLNAYFFYVKNKESASGI
ncbi:hypothetical protein [Soonwooa sp.]|uniref:hypothetical protein n=1 Tax=Soonwooa sp. TaxID=1938592 RepID=UPI00260232D5|nr:hypothetical protein [Soonwooa sp.]